MSIFGLTLRRLGCTINQLIPSLKSQSPVLQPTIKSNISPILSNFKSQPIALYPVFQGFFKVPQACFHSSAPMQISLEYMHNKGLYKKLRKPKKSPLEGRPQMRGVVLKTLIKKPKKPNSANRKCVRLRLTNGKEATAYVPGEGHNLQEHNIVLVQGGKLQDTPGVKLVCVRGKYDLTHVKKKI